MQVLERPSPIDMDGRCRASSCERCGVSAERSAPGKAAYAGVEQGIDAEAAGDWSMDLSLQGRQVNELTLVE